MPIGTAAAIAIGLGTAGAQTASSIYGARSANRTNQQALAAQQRSDEINAALAREQLAQQAALEREARQETTRQFNTTQATQQQRWNDFVSMNRPTWELGSQVLGGLTTMAGMPSGGGSGAPGRAPMPPSVSVPLAAVGTGLGPHPVGNGQTPAAGQVRSLAQMGRPGGGPPMVPPVGGLSSLFDMAALA